MTPRLTDLDFFEEPPPLRGSLDLSRFLLPRLGSPYLGLLAAAADMLLGDCVASKSFDCTLVENRTESSSVDFSETEPAESAGAPARLGAAWAETVETVVRAWDRAFFEIDPENSETPLPKDFAKSLR